jgi:hypothetical protein
MLLGKRAELVSAVCCYAESFQQTLSAREVANFAQLFICERSLAPGSGRRAKSSVRSVSEALPHRVKMGAAPICLTPD